MIPIAAVLHLEPQSESIAYRFYRDTVDGRPLLTWWVDRVLRSSGVENLVVVCHTERERETLASLVPSGVTIHRTQHYCERRTLAELARTKEDRVFAVLPLGFAFAPNDLLACTTDHHGSHDNTFTRVHGLPAGVGPLVVQRDFLLWLDECGLPGLPLQVAAAGQRLVDVARTTKQKLPFPIRFAPFEAGGRYRADVTRLPRGVSLQNAGDVDTARRVVALLGEAQGEPLCALETWKEERILARARPEPAITSTSGVPRKDARKRILYVSNPSAFSGAEESLCQMVRHVDDRRFDKVALIAAEGMFTDRLRRAGTTVIVRGSDFSRPNTENLSYAVSALRALAPDIVHMNAPSGLPFVSAAKLLGIPVVLHVRNGWMADYEDFVGPADALVAVSKFLRREILTFDVPSDRVHVIYDEADPEYFRKVHFDRQAVRRDLGLPEDAKVALMIARMAPNKRHDLLLAAAAVVKSSVPNLRLVLKGDVFGQAQADLCADIQEQARALGLTDIITWLKFVPDIRALHAAADVLVLCSDREGLGRCVVEAMDMELPVVVTDSGGSHEIVGAEERGYVVRGGDAADLARKMTEALTNDAGSRMRAKAAREYAATRLSARAAAVDMMRIYDGLRLDEQHAL